MRAVVIGDGGARGVAERPDPVPGDTELVVAVQAAGVNSGAASTRRRRAGRSTCPVSSWPAKWSAWAAG